MKKHSIHFLISTLLFSIFSMAGFGQLSTREVDRLVEDAMEKFNVAGVAVGIVKDGEVFLAKGYGVDVVFELLQSLGYTDILVEIGGEVRCAGLNGEGEYWKIGIDKPILDVLPGMELQTIISMDNQALATSGDYRNYFEYNGEIFSHMIDPITGYPTKNNVASVSVTAPNCTTADALATALMVIGLDGIKLINLIEEVEAILIIRTDNNELTSVESFGWRKN